MFDRIILIITLLLVALLSWQVINLSDEDEQQTAVSTIKSSKTKTVKTPQVVLPDFASFVDVNQKKQAFIDFMMPAIEQANREIQQQREFLLELNLNQISRAEREMLAEIAEEYQEPRQPKQTLQSWRNNLLKKVDIIPPSLALAQSANESAWGTSRFAKQGFNFYGQWCFSEGCGLVPNARPDGKRYEVRVFETPQDSVAAYMRNLNAFHTYEDLREIRSALRDKEQLLLGTKLSNGLLAYSQRRDEYIDEIQSMIKFNDWLTFDQQWAENQNAQ